MFVTNTSLLQNSAQVLRQRSQLRWVIGGACSGKSTVCRVVSERTGVPVYDMDEAVFGRWRFDPVRHPATTAWFRAENPLGWMLSLPWPEFDALYRAANAEYLDLLAEELSGQPDTPLLLDGGITHPSVLVWAVPPERIVCLETADEIRVREWETAPARAEMRQWVADLPEGPAKWRRFLDYDREMTATLDRESRRHAIQIFSWDESTHFDDFIDKIVNYLSWPQAG